MVISRILIITVMGFSLLTGFNENEKTKILRLAHGLDTGHPVHKAMVYMSEAVEKKSGGKMSLQVYPSQQLGTERQCVELLQIGSLDMTPAVLIFTPIFLPVVTGPEIGLDAVHFGIILVLNLCIGLVTPPVGSLLFIGCSVADIGIEKVIGPLIPLFIAMIIVLLLVTYLPDISLWLPGIFNKL